MKRKENKNMHTEPEYGVDSRYTSSEVRESEATLLMEARLARMKKLPESQVVRAKLLQLKLNMEEFIQNPVYGDHNHFSEFVQVYVDTIYKKRSSFAKDIDITPVSLSQVLNNHRDPKDEFIRRLMIHSEIAYKNVCEFKKKTWYQVYFHEKICDTMSKQDEWRPDIEKHVKLSKSIGK